MSCSVNEPRGFTHLVHLEALDLPLEDRHAAARYHRADVRHHSVAEHVVHQLVVPLVPGGCDVLHRETVIVIYE